MKTKTHINPRNTGHLGKKRTKAFCEAQSKRLLGQMKSPATRKRMQTAAKKRWQIPGYRIKHGAIMRKRWAAVRKAELFLKRKGIMQ